ncbi:MAG: Crp/Fnr family transcriptional regulator [Ruminococcus sp.]|nr:Crp/Fnr family transcriptional regulator [Ruminococcus sp.]
MKNFTEYFRDEHLTLLRHHILLSGLSEHEIFMFIQHSKPLYIHLTEGKSNRISGIHSHMIGIVFSGYTYIYNVDYEGNKTLLKSIGKDETSGTLYAMFDYFHSLIELTAKEDSDILLIPPESLFIADEKLAVIQQKILVNMLASQRQHFLEISEHIACLSQRNIRDKILNFLKVRCEREHSYNFTIPYSREELANYLAVDRASLSRSLGELKNEGIIDFKKNQFTILSTAHFKYE